MRDSQSRMTAVALLIGCGAALPAESAIFRVPQNYATIQAAIDAAPSGDTVLVARGTYTGGSLVITGKTVTLASLYIQTGDPNDIAQTILDGGDPILSIEATAGAATTVRGLTFRNGGYQLVNRARRMNLLNDRFLGGSNDQVSFEGAGGLVKDCFFDNAGDDGIDSDEASDPTVDHNTIQNSHDDGMELRLHSYTGSTLEIVIRNNTFTGCHEDGLQLIDYAGASSRHFRIEHNVFANNAMVGLGCTADGNSSENFAGAPLVEPVEVIGNTFSGNPYGITGGDNMLVMNNIVAGATMIRVKRVAGSSSVTYNDLWNNGTDTSGSNLVTATTLHADPKMSASYDLQPGSPCIDAGTASIVWNGATVNAPPYSGAKPDLGAHETGTVSVPDEAAPGKPELTSVRPNPSHSGFAVAYTLADTSPAHIEVMDLAGRRLITHHLAARAGTGAVVTLAEARTLPAGLYVVRLTQNGHASAMRCVVLK